MTPALARCPFCTSAQVALIATDHRESAPAIVCHGCGVVVSGSGFDVDALVAAWNRRAA